jgi:pimeloyl-ACP methyl ester carboxylesterase
MNLLRLTITVAITAAALLISGATPQLNGAALAGQTEERESVALSSFGNFFAGGEYDRNHPSRHIAGQIYAQYVIPAKRRHPFPILMIHGGNQTGAGWFTTPDGRGGWVPWFVRQGYSVYVVDQVGRGRSPFIADVYGKADEQDLEYVLQKFAAPERYKLWPQARLHTQWPGKAEPGDPSFDQYWSSDAQTMDNRVLESTLNVKALAMLLDRIGPVILLVHSQSGGLAWPLAQARPKLVKAIVAAEPAGPPVHDVVVHSIQRFDFPWEKTVKQNEQDYFRDNPRVKPYGLTTIPLEYLPAVTAQSPLKFVQQERSETPDLARCWRQKEPARKLVAVGERPVVVIQAEASFYAGYNHCNVEYLRQAGVNADFIKLADQGIHGNGHMMMFEKNSDQIAKVISDWLDKNMTKIESPRAAH